MILDKNYLMHRSHKYTSRKWKNGRWVYTYDLNGVGRRTSTDVEKDFSKKNGYAFVTNEQTYKKDGKTIVRKEYSNTSRNGGKASGATTTSVDYVKDKDGKLYEYNTVKGKYVKEVTKDGKQKYESSAVTKGKEFVNKWLNKNKKK